MVGVLFFAVLVAGLSVILHRLIAYPLVATPVSAVLAAGAFQATAPALTGYDDPFFPMGFILCVVYGLVGSFVIGKVMRAYGWAKKRHGAT